METIKNYIRGDIMPIQTETNKEEGLNEFSKPEEEEEEQYIYYACRKCGGRHPQGVSCEEDGGEE